MVAISTPFVGFAWGLSGEGGVSESQFADEKICNAMLVVRVAASRSAVAVPVEKPWACATTR